MGSTLPTIELFSDLHCPWAYLATYRLRRLWPAYAGRVLIRWRALSLELINRRPTPKNIVDIELPLIAEQEPDIPLGPWQAPEWTYPVTILPAFEALQCALRQGHEAAWEFNWRVRRAFFAESRCISMRHVLLEIAAECGLDVDRFRADFDSGSARPAVLAESARGWHELKVPGSPTFVLPSGRQVANPGAVRVTWGPEHEVLAVEPPEQPWEMALRGLLDVAIVEGEAGSGTAAGA